ncbi:hypothetical protein Pcinc_025254 [Petrolisthes cinctipes]|uniref:Carboxypeptidase n=1 Tax=Petrolisthes cinctipes TaxID=88211 RepID=A0AAE1K9Q4_PETCI|nr:hypothetical protein Pcinc_025254 [Petrolisthes cinctipes]
MFFWLYYTTADVDYKTRPLVLWLQGGPGASSTGIGNFLEIGPQNLSLGNRTDAWTKEVNVVFVDNPVGTGYSFVEDPKLIPRNNTAIAYDLIKFMSGFFVKVPEFQDVPLYIFSESYGGKMAAQFAVTLQRAIQMKKVRCQLAGVALGDSWISPVDAVLSWGPYLYATSLIDSAGEAKINGKTTEVRNAVAANKMLEATKLWAQAEDLIENVTNGVNFYNILTKRTHNNTTTTTTTSTSSSTANEVNNSIRQEAPDQVLSDYNVHLYNHYVGDVSADLDHLMNGPMREKLKVIPENVTWGGQSKMVFEALSEDFMTSAVKNVELLLNTTNLKVVVYNGQLDLIVSTLGAQKWVEHLHWAGTSHWVNADRRPIEDPSGATGAFSKTFKNFTFYWILNAGHMIPSDAGAMAKKMMQEIVGIKVR